LDGCAEYRWPLLFCPASSFRSRISLGDGTGNGPMISLRPSLITEHHSVSSLSDPAREASPCSRYLRAARDVDTTCTVRRNVHGSMEPKVRAHRAPNLLRGCVGRSHVDHTEARNDFVGCFGRSDRSRLVPRDDITAVERGAMVRNGLSEGRAVVLGPETDSGRCRSSARPDHHRRRAGRGRQFNRAAPPSLP